MGNIDFGKVLIASIGAAFLKLIVLDGLFDLRGSLGPLDSLAAFACFAICYALLGGKFDKGASRKP